MHLKTCPTCHARYPLEFELCPQDGARLESENGTAEAQTDWPAGKVIGGKYRVSSTLGEDEVAAIYEAHTISLNAPRVIRVLKSRFASDAGACEDFRKTADLLQRAAQPNLIAVEGRGNAEDGRPFLVTEFFPGQTLRELMQSEGPLEPQRACSITSQIALALSATHRLGLLHLNLTPSNVLVSGGPGQESVKIQGFGVAYVRMCRTRNGLSASAGLNLRDRLPADFRYASPELALGTLPHLLDERADLYSLGVVLYEMLTGQVALTGAGDHGTSAESAVATIAARLDDSPALLRAGHGGMEVPPFLGAVVMQLLERRPELRLASAQDVIEKIRLALSRMTSIVKPSLSTEPAESAPPAGFAELAPPRIRVFAGEAVERTPEQDLDLIAASPSSSQAAPDSANRTNDAQRAPAPRLAAVPTRQAAVASGPLAARREATSTLFKSERPPVESHFGRWALAAVVVLIAVAGALFFITRGRTQWLGAGPLSPIKSDELRSVEGANSASSLPPQSTSQPGSQPQTGTRPSGQLVQPPQQPVGATPGGAPSPGENSSPPSGPNGPKYATGQTGGTAPAIGSGNTSATSKATTAMSASPGGTPSLSPEDVASQVKRAIAAGDVFFELGQYDYAIRAYQGPLKYDPKNQELKLKIERAQKAKAAEEQYLGQ